MHPMSPTGLTWQEEKRCAWRRNMATEEATARAGGKRS